MSKIIVDAIQKTGGAALTIPAADGTAGQFLKTDGSAALSFATAADATKLPLAGGTMTGATVFGDQLSSRFVAKDYAETVYAGGNTSTAVTLAETNGNVQTFTMPSGSGLQAGSSVTLILTQDGTGSRTGTFTAVKFAGGTAPELTTTATTGIDILTFYTFNGGASPVWYGWAAGMDMQTPS